VKRFHRGVGAMTFSLGRKGGSWLVASETCAIDTIGLARKARTASRRSSIGTRRF
jgi:glutamine phosphoribosylpyrophosphate amidotransferase